MMYLKLYEDFDESNQICQKYNISWYTINLDGTGDIDGQVDLSDEYLSELPLKFGRVSGNFICHSNSLVSLAGSPHNVGGSFDCSHNRLFSLKGGPQYVGGYFTCAYNNLNSLLDGPNTVVGNYYFDNNELTNVIGFPKKRKRLIAYANNPVDEILILVGPQMTGFKQDTMTSKFIDYLNEYNVIQGERIFEEGLKQAYYMVMKKELSLEHKEFKNYILF